MVVCFQAEDGIRDYKVTGVQTCALPILTITLGLDGSGKVDIVAGGYEDWIRQRYEAHRTPAKAGAQASGTRKETKAGPRPSPDRKSTRLNSSHLVISYAVFCLKKKKQ